YARARAGPGRGRHQADGDQGAGDPQGGPAQEVRLSRHGFPVLPGTPASAGVPVFGAGMTAHSSVESRDAGSGMRAPGWGGRAARNEGIAAAPHGCMMRATVLMR